MKILLFCLLFPLISFGQTIHVADDNIVYNGEVKISSLPSTEIFRRMQTAAITVIGEKHTEETTSAGLERKVKGYLVLSTPYHIIRQLHFTLHLQAMEGGYRYVVDNVYLNERRRGGKSTVKQAAELLEGREDTGAAASESEKLLNEIDLRIQKMLVLLHNAMRDSK